jgi:hypothetical protein
MKNLLDKASLNLSKQQQGSGGGGNFDFRRYRKQLDSAKRQKIGYEADDFSGTHGAFTTTTTNSKSPTINKMMNNSQLCSIIGPKRAKNINKASRKSSSSKISSTTKRIRIDSLGPY